MAEQESGAFPTRWVCRDGAGPRAAGATSARRAAQTAVEQGLPVELTVVGRDDPDPRWEDHDLLVALGDDPRDTAAWWPAVAARLPVLLPAVPGTAEVLRDALCLGAAATVRDRENASAVLAAVRGLTATPDPHRELAAEVVRRRQRGQDVDTRPRALAVAVDARALRTALTTLRYVSELGGTCHLVVHRSLTRRGWREPVEAASITYVDDPLVSSVPARAERLLLLRAPERAGSVLPRVLPRLRRNVPGRALPVLDVVERAALGGIGRWATAGPALHDRTWAPVQVRLRPWLLARNLFAPKAQPLPWEDDGLDLVVALGPDAQALVWRLLRRQPRAASRGSITYQAVVEIVRRRAREAVGG